MKQTKIYFALVLLIVFASGCSDKIYETFNANSPVYMSYDELRSAVKMTAAREMNNPGKIYFKDQYIFINEKMKGVHVYDVTDPANPQNKGFIEIPGNIDIAIKDNILYADSYIAPEKDDSTEPSPIDTPEGVGPCGCCLNQPFSTASLMQPLLQNSSSSHVSMSCLRGGLLE